MKITIVLEKVGAPSRSKFHKGLVVTDCPSHEQVNDPADSDGEYGGKDFENEQLLFRVLVPWNVLLSQEADDNPDADGLHQRDHREAKGRDHEPTPQQLQRHTVQQVRHDHQGDQAESNHLAPPQGTVFSTAKLPQRLSVFQDSDNAMNIAYYELEVKPNKKSASLLFLVSNL